MAKGSIRERAERALRESGDVDDTPAAAEENTPIKAPPERAQSIIEVTLAEPQAVPLAVGRVVSRLRVGDHVGGRVIACLAFAEPIEGLRGVEVTTVPSRGDGEEMRSVVPLHRIAAVHLA